MRKKSQEYHHSNNNDVSILVVSFDGYQDLWYPYYHCLFKYWPDCPYPIFHGSNYLVYPDPRIKSIQIGPDLDYSSNLLAMIDRIETPWIILSIEDELLSSQINTARFTNLIEVAQNNQVGYLKLSANTPPWAFTKDKTQEMGPLPKGVKYRATMGFALWNKNVLIRLLRQGENAWEFERNGSRRSNSFIEPFYCFSSTAKSNPPFSYIHGVVRGRWMRNALPFLRKEGLGDYIPNRPVQSLWSYLYTKMYGIRLDFYRRIGRYWYE